MTPLEHRQHSHPLLAIIEAWVEGIVLIQPTTGMSTDYRTKLDVLERIVELGRLTTGQAENAIRVDDLLVSGVDVDPETRQLAIGRSSRAGDAPWPAPSARVPYELQVPLLIYLVHSRSRREPIGDLLADFVTVASPFLTPWDMESTRTGVPRIATNTRLAARDLRAWGLLRYTRGEAFKTWELSHVGLIVGAGLSLRGATVSLQTRALKASHGGSGWLTERIQDLWHDLSDVVKLKAILHAISRPNSDILKSMEKIQELLVAYGHLAHPRASGREVLHESRAEAEDLIECMQGVIRADDLADDVVTDLALRSLLGAHFGAPLDDGPSGPMDLIG